MICLVLWKWKEQECEGGGDGDQKWEAFGDLEADGPKFLLSCREISG
jgi:hypothetical protein